MAKKKRGQTRVVKKVDKVERKSEKGISRQTVLLLILLGIFVLAIVIFLLFRGQTVQPAPIIPEQAPTLTGAQAASQSLLDRFIAWYNSPSNGGTQKFLIMFLVFFFIYAIVDFLPFLEEQSEWIKVPIAAIIAILGVWFLLPEQVYSIMWSYQSLGIVLGGLFPFLVIAVFTIKLGEKSPKYIWLTKVIWIAFAVAMSIKFYPAMKNLFTSSNQTVSPENGGYFGVVFYGLTLLATLAWFFIGEKIIQRTFKSKINEGILEATQANLIDIEARISLLENNRLELTKANVRPQDIRMQRLNDQIKALKELEGRA